MKLSMGTFWQLIETIACVVLHYYPHYSLFNGYILAETGLEVRNHAYARSYYSSFTPHFSIETTQKVDSVASVSSCCET